MDFHLEEGLSDRSTLNTNRRDHDPTLFPLIREQEQEELVAPVQNHAQDLPIHDQNRPIQDEAELNLNLNLPIQGGVEPNQGGVEPVQGHIQDEVELVVGERIPRRFIRIPLPNDGEVYEGMHYYVMPSDQDQEDEEFSNHTSDNEEHGELSNHTSDTEEHKESSNHTSDNEEHGESSNQTSNRKQEHSLSSSQTTDNEQEEEERSNYCPNTVITKRQRSNLDGVGTKRHCTKSDEETNKQLFREIVPTEGRVPTMAPADRFPELELIFTSVLENTRP